MRSFRRFRLKFLLACAVAATASMALSASASATVTGVPYGGTTDTRPGGHGVLTTGVNFTYSDTSQTVKRILIDTPAGGVGNPNAVPYADRCTKETFDTGVCDAKSQLGVVTISAIAYLGIIPVPMNDMTGTISQIQTDPEVPTLVGAYIKPSLGDAIRSYARYYPVTSGPDGDFRIRTETDNFPTKAGTPLGDAPIQITKYEQKLFGKLDNGAVFITNPTRCDTWMSGGYAEFWSPESGADSDPFMTGTNTFFKSADVPTEPDCSTRAPFTTTADAAFSGDVRGAHADFSTELKIADHDADPQSPAVPKKVVATLPKALTIDVAQLGRVCSDAEFTADSCPATTKVGSASIATPMIVAGLQGDAYLVKASGGRNLPDLGIRVRGAINFSLRGANQFVNVNQLQTTFENIPPLGFSSFKLNIAGGVNGLLLVRECPTDGSEPADGGSVNFAMDDAQGQSLAINSPTQFVPPSCTSYSVTIKRVKKCVKRRTLKVTPRIASRSQVRFVRYYLGKKKLKSVARSPFSAKLKLSKTLRSGKKQTLKIKVYYKPSRAYPSGRVVTRTVRFKLCR
jgi:hypothetical protein